MKTNSLEIKAFAAMTQPHENALPTMAGSRCCICDRTMRQRARGRTPAVWFRRGVGRRPLVAGAHGTRSHHGSRDDLASADAKERKIKKPPFPPQWHLSRLPRRCAGVDKPFEERKVNTGIRWGQGWTIGLMRSI